VNVIVELRLIEITHKINTTVMICKDKERMTKITQKIILFIVI